MICPQTKAECATIYGCSAMGCREEKINPPKPTLAEIERLVDAYAEKATFTPYAHPHDYKNAKADEAAARAALMAAIRAYGEG